MWHFKGGEHTARYLSYVLKLDSPLYPGTPVTRIESISSFDKGGVCNTRMVSFHNHSGTHVDAPNHFNPNGLPIAQFTADQLIFEKPVLVNLPKGKQEPITRSDLEGIRHRVETADLLMIRTGFWRARSDTVCYSEQNPWLHPEAALYLRDELPNLKAVGLDTVSAGCTSFREEGVAAHRILTGFQSKDSRFILIIEDMDLSLTPDEMERYRRVIVAPWMIEGIDSAPCSIIAL